MTTDHPYWTEDEFKASSQPLLQTFKGLQDMVTHMKGEIPRKFAAYKPPGQKALSGTACWQALKQEAPGAFESAHNEGLCRVNTRLGIPIILLPHPSGEKAPCAVRFKMVDDDMLPTESRSLLARYVGSQGQARLPFPFSFNGSEELEDAGTWVVAGRRRERKGARGAILSFVLIVDGKAVWTFDHKRILSAITEWECRAGHQAEAPRNFRFEALDPTEGTGTE